jgi:H+-transporting ATPase
MMKLIPSKEFEKMSISETLKYLESGVDGLSSDEAGRRLRIYGYNYVEEERKSLLNDFLKRLWGPMPWLLEVAIVLSIIIEHYVEALIIATLIVVNAFIGFRHTRTSERVLRLLRSKLAIRARVLRDGKWITIDAKYIVPGDIAALGLGDIVPADCKIIEGNALVDQSMLTGESLPVEVSVGNVIYAGSILKRGQVKTVITNIGKNTYFGRTVELVKTAQPKSHQQEVMLQITKYSMYIGVAAIVAALVFAIMMGLKNTPVALVTFAVTILMGAVPVALPAVLTIMQAVGAMRLASKEVLVTKLGSIEDAASIDVMCLDKTGTITENRSSIVNVIPFNNYSVDDVIEHAFYSSSQDGKDLIDQIVVEYAKSKGLPRRKHELIEFKPFDPSIKRTEAMVEANGKRLVVVKGAPQIVAELVTSDSEKAEAMRISEELAEKGYRSLAVAVKEDASFRFTGLLALVDSPRPNARELIENIKRLGVEPKMVTGDNALIAKEIARQVGIGEKIVKGEYLRKAGEDDKGKVIEEASVFAEVYPEDKYIIVKSLQAKGHIVGVMGDGVNDAPALKQAELGIAVANATDVAKASAGAVLLKFGLEGVVDILATGREVYQRALTWIINKITKTVQFTLLLAIGFFILRYDIISLLGMTLLVFSNDFATMSLATDNATPATNPSKWRVKDIVYASSILGSLLLVEGLIAILVGSAIYRFTLQQMQTFILLIMVFTSQFRIMIVRERREFWKSRPGKELTLSIAGVLAVFIVLGTSRFVLTPIGLDKTIVALTYSAIFTLSIDPVKVRVFRRYGIM